MPQLWINETDPKLHNLSISSVNIRLEYQVTFKPKYLLTNSTGLFLFLLLQFQAENSLKFSDIYLRTVITRTLKYLVELNVLYQISPSRNSKTNFLLIRMPFNQDKMLVRNASIWVRGPCISSTSKLENIVGVINLWLNVQEHLSRKLEEKSLQLTW